SNSRISKTANATNNATNHFLNEGRENRSLGLLSVSPLFGLAFVLFHNFPALLRTVPHYNLTKTFRHWRPLLYVKISFSIGSELSRVCREPVWEIPRSSSKVAQYLFTDFKTTSFSSGHRV